ncbi:UBX domain-containing protein 4-like [Liolophura sinensis]|uniref:UBX domain-containing protein 4-like n=1 Tax=Liolophura sinensis TaxID=3198878 RepID=UPI0031581176
MRWFEGSIPDAIQLAKSKGSVFIVYIAGEDEESKKMEAVLKDSQIVQTCESAECVAIRLMSNSEACGQFSMFYPVVVVPSVFLIGNNGIPLEVTGGAVSAKDFRVKVESAVQANKKQQPGSPGGASAPSGQPPTEASPSVVSQAEGASEPREDVQERVERAKKLIAEKQAKKALEEKEKQIKEEKERRLLGQSVLQSKQRKEEMEAREIQNELRKRKEEDRKARERVKEQIARDRADRAAKYQKDKEDIARVKEEQERAKLEAQQMAAAELASKRSETARLQFRLPDGTSVTETFPSGEPLSAARDFISEYLGAGFGSPVLSTIYPRKSFTDSDMGESFSSLQLSPSAVIMVLPARGQSSQSAVSSTSFVSLIFTPLLAIWNFVYNLLFASPPRPRGAYNPGRSQQASRAADSDDDNIPSETTSRSNRPRTAYKRRTPASVSQRDGNIHKFSNADDDDDEQATWNGNSTQQM